MELGFCVASARCTELQRVPCFRVVDHSEAVGGA